MPATRVLATEVLATKVLATELLTMVIRQLEEVTRWVFILLAAMQAITAGQFNMEMLTAMTQPA